MVSNKRTRGSFATIAKKAKDDREWSFTDMAHYCQIGRGEASRVLGGTRQPTPRTIAAFAEGFAKTGPFEGEPETEDAWKLLLLKAAVEQRKEHWDKRKENPS